MSLRFSMRGVARTLSSPKMTVACLSLLALLVVCGTIHEARAGLYEARRIFFDSWGFLAFGWLPLPGALTVLGVFFIHLVALMLGRLERSVRQAGLWLAYGGLLVLLAGGLVTHCTAGEYTLTLAEGEETDRAQSARDGETLALPVTIRLVDFRKEFHPGSTIPKSFASRIQVTSGTAAREVTVSMNRPFHHRGYTFYQSAYSETPDGLESSTFAVRYNRTRNMPYVATVMTSLGLVATFLIGLTQGGARKT